MHTDGVDSRPYTGWIGYRTGRDVALSKRPNPKCFVGEQVFPAGKEKKHPVHNFFSIHRLCKVGIPIDC